MFQRQPLSPYQQPNVCSSSYVPLSLTSSKRGGQHQQQQQHPQAMAVSTQRQQRGSETWQRQQQQSAFSHTTSPQRACNRLSPPLQRTAASAPPARRATNRTVATEPTCATTRLAGRCRARSRRRTKAPRGHTTGGASRSRRSCTHALRSGRARWRTPRTPTCSSSRSMASRSAARSTTPSTSSALTKIVSFLSACCLAAPFRHVLPRGQLRRVPRVRTQKQHGLVCCVLCLLIGGASQAASAVSCCDCCDLLCARCECVLQQRHGISAGLASS